MKDETIKWFCENYLEDEITINLLLYGAEVISSSTIEDIKQACMVIRKNQDGTTFLEDDLKILIEISKKGIKGSKAGEKVRMYYEIDNIINE